MKGGNPMSKTKHAFEASSRNRASGFYLNCALSVQNDRTKNKISSRCKSRGKERDTTKDT